MSSTGLHANMLAKTLNYFKWNKWSELLKCTDCLVGVWESALQGSRGFEQQDWMTNAFPGGDGLGSWNLTLKIQMRAWYKHSIIISRLLNNVKFNDIPLLSTVDKAFLILRGRLATVGT